MDLSLQAKLLRVLQDGRVRRIGGQKEKQVDVRVITTMNMHPDQAFKENRLREDLYYRLSVVYIYLPPLRKRKDDIFFETVDVAGPVGIGRGIFRKEDITKAASIIARYSDIDRKGEMQVAYKAVSGNPSGMITVSSISEKELELMRA